MKDQSQLKKALFICFTVIMIVNFFLLVLDAFLILQLTFFSPTGITTHTPTELSLAEAPPTETEAALVSTETVPSEFTATVELTSTVEKELPTATITPTMTSEPLVQNGVYIVKSGESLEDIADKLGISSENLRQINQMIGDAVLPGQNLIVPPDGIFTRPPYTFSPLFSSENYSIKIEGTQPEAVLFDLNFIPEQLPQTAVEPVFTLMQNSVSQVITFYHIDFDTKFNVFVAGTVFETDHNQRSASQVQSNSELYLLFDGTGNREDIEKLSTFAFARLHQDIVLGEAASPLLKEGAATYISLSTSQLPTQQIPLRQYCKAYQTAAVLPDLADSELAFKNTNTDLRNFHTAGCFFDFLLTRSDLETVTTLYQGGNYSELYGKPLDTLLTDFENWLQTLPTEERTHPLQYVSIETDLTNLYDSFMPGFDGSEEHINIYRELDLARIAMLEGRYDDAGNHLLIAKLAIQTNSSSNGGGGGAQPDDQVSAEATPTRIDLNITLTPPALPTPQP